MNTDHDNSSSHSDKQFTFTIENGDDLYTIISDLSDTDDDASDDGGKTHRRAENTKISNSIS